MGAALKLLVAGPSLAYVVLFGLISVLLEVFMRYSRYVSVLKWLSLSLFAYVATLFAVHLDWADIGFESAACRRFLGPQAISPWLSPCSGRRSVPICFSGRQKGKSKTKKKTRRLDPLNQAPRQSAPRIGAHTASIRWIGMAFSNLIALCIVLTTAATLHAHGITDIQTSSQAAEALRPIAGKFAFTVSPSALSGPACWPCRFCPGPALTLWEKPCVGRSDWRACLWQAPRPFTELIAMATLVGGALNFTAHRSGQSAVLECGDQWRRRGARHGHDHEHGDQRTHHGDFSSARVVARAWLAGDLDHGSRRHRHVRDMGRLGAFPRHQRGRGPG